MLIFKGTLGAKKTGSKEGRAWATLQFMERDDRGMRVLDVYLPDNSDHSRFVEGKPVELAVTVSAKDGRVFYRATGEAVPATA